MTNSQLLKLVNDLSDSLREIIPFAEGELASRRHAESKDGLGTSNVAGVSAAIEKAKGLEVRATILIAETT